MAYSRTRDSRGLNIPEYQSGSSQNVKYETVIIPSTSQVAFGGYNLLTCNNDWNELIQSLLVSDIS